jgi:mannosyltransferase OCH1-like enzyme
MTMSKANSLGSVESAARRNAIPPILHQTWRTTELPVRFASWSETWKRLHPHWDYRFYTDRDIRSTIIYRAPQWLRCFDALSVPVQRVDFFRYLIVFLDGGLYADLDMVAYQPSDPLLSDASCVLSVEHELTASRQARLKFRMPYQLANCIFAAAPGHPFLGELLEEVAHNASRPVHGDSDVLETTGPYLVTRLAYELPALRRGAVKVLPQIYWMPPREYPRIGPLATKIYARHMGSGTWRAASRSATLWTHLKEWNRWPSPFALSAPDLT